MKLAWKIIALTFICASRLLAAQQPDDKDKSKAEQDKKTEEAEPPKQPPAESSQRPAEKQKSDQKNKKPRVVENTNFDAPVAVAPASGEQTKRIPEEQFRASFGREHAFKTLKKGDKRFESGGFRFEAAQPWPQDWKFEDACFVEEYGSDYYLVDVEHPEKRVRVNVVEGEPKK